MSDVGARKKDWFCLAVIQPFESTMVRTNGDI